jgi:hypothetical protein
VTKLPMNAPKVICSSLRQIFPAFGFAQKGVSVILLSITDSYPAGLINSLARHLLDADAATWNCRGLLLNDTRADCIARGDMSYTKGVFGQ